MTKPELMAPGGTYAYDSGMSRFAESPYGKVVGASHKPDRLFVGGTGTSLAAPLVAHAALRVLGRYPSLSANAIRALLLATTDPVESMLTGGVSAEQRAADMRLAGFGQVVVDHAEYSADHRVVVLAEDTIQMNQVHFYMLPVPDAFFSPGPKMVALGLAFNPDVRATRLAYLSNRMSVFVYRGVSVQHVRAKYALHPDDDAPPEELETYRCKDLQPPDRIRRRGANQAASQVWSQGWDKKYGGQLVIAVRNTSRWAADGETQDYALAVTMRTHEHLEPPLYARLRAQLPLITEIEPEIELE